jgi:hypothetical protein
MERLHEFISLLASFHRREFLGRAAATHDIEVMFSRNHRFQRVIAPNAGTAQASAAAAKSESPRPRFFRRRWRVSLIVEFSRATGFNVKAR